MKITDFGLARAVGEAQITQTGQITGTPEFMSPEQAQGLILDARADIYSLAVILYEVLTGKLPFDGKSPMEYIQLHVTSPPIPLEQRVAGKSFAPGLGIAVTKALAKSPADRYSSAREFAEALRPFAQGGAQLADPSAWPASARPFGPAEVGSGVAGAVGGATAAFGGGAGAGAALDSSAASPRETGQPTLVNPPRPASDRFGISGSAPAPAAAAVTAASSAAQRSRERRGASLGILLLVATLSVVAGVLLTFVALKLFG